MAYSPDAINWTAIPNAYTNPGGSGIYNNVTGIAWGNNMFVAVGYDDYTSYSPDGINWTRNTINSVAYAASTIVWGKDKFVAGKSNGRIAYSSDGINWTNAPDATSIFTDTFNDIIAIAWGNDMFVAVAENGKMAYSSDGISWTGIPAGNSGSKFSLPSPKPKGIVWGNNKFVAVGESARMAYSANASAWTSILSSNSTFFADSRWYDIFAIAYGNGKFIAGSGYNSIGYPGSGRMAYSTDGIAWNTISATESTFGDAGIFAITYGNNKFVAVGKDGRMAYSTNK